MVPAAKLRILVVHEDETESAALLRVLARQGHDVTAAPDVSADVIVAGLQMEALRDIAGGADCPVVAVAGAGRPDLATLAALDGVYAVVTDGEGADWDAVLQVALGRFAEIRSARSALARRDDIERASGILMERHSVGGAAALEMLRIHARRHNRKLADVARAVVDGHELLPAIPPKSAP